MDDPHDTRKTRITIADAKGNSGATIDTYSGCAASTSDNILTQLALELRSDAREGEGAVFVEDEVVGEAEEFVVYALGHARLVDVARKGGEGEVSSWVGAGGVDGGAGVSLSVGDGDAGLARVVWVVHGGTVRLRFDFEGDDQVADGGAVPAVGVDRVEEVLVWDNRDLE